MLLEVLCIYSNLNAKFSFDFNLFPLLDEDFRPEGEESDVAEEFDSDHSETSEDEEGGDPGQPKKEKEKKKKKKKSKTYDDEVGAEGRKKSKKSKVKFLRFSCQQTEDDYCVVGRKEREGSWYA